MILTVLVFFVSIVVIAKIVNTYESTLREEREGFNQMHRELFPERQNNDSEDDGA